VLLTILLVRKPAMSPSAIQARIDILRYSFVDDPPTGI
jgi:hypothetical protein